MIRVAVVGLGKMGLSHHAIVKAHPDVEVVGVCDSSAYLLGLLKKYTGVETYSQMDRMIAETKPDAVVISTPSALHASMVRSALEQGIHVFCEKPFVLDDVEGTALAERAQELGLVTQVGYHNRFVGAFREVKRLLELGAVGEVTHILAEAYGPVVLKPSGGTWRSKSSEGGGCLYDYAAHPINLVNWYLGEPVGVGGTVLNRIFSREIDDEVSSTLYYDGGRTAQVSVNWSDESVRKMTTRISVWGTQGKIFADRQEIQVYLREGEQVPEGYEAGWNVRYTTELTEPVRFYLRGEEYSAQLDHFFERVAARKAEGENTFATAVATDRTIALMIRDARTGPSTLAGTTTAADVTTTPASRARDLAGRALVAGRGIAAAVAKKADEALARRRAAK